MVLLWLLIRRLAFRLPTVLQVHKDYAILFHGNGVSQFAHPDDPRFCDALTCPSGDDPEQIDDSSKRVWALVDTNTLLLEPAGIFKYPGSFFVVNATSLRFNWLDKVGHNKFYMKPWSLSEILQVYDYPVSRGPKNSCFLQSLAHRSRGPL